MTCLKKSVYLTPFEWIAQYNLGLVYLYTEQPVSAFHHLNCAVQLKQEIGLVYMFMGVTLSQLNDIENAIQYYDKAIELEPNNAFYYLNYAISLINHDMVASATEKYQAFKELREEEEGEEIAEAASKLEELLNE